MKQPDYKIVQDVLNNDAHPEDAKWIAQWFITDKGNRYLHNYIDNDIEKLKSGQPILFSKSDIGEEDIYKRIEQQFHRKKINRILFRIAAVIIPFIIILSFAWQLDRQVNLFSNKKYNELVVPKGERQTFVFQDGTKIYINADSKLRYPEKFNLTSRNIEFEGEAYFVVAKNPRRPFIVNVEGLQVKVLGTSFNIKAYPEKNNVVVQLDEGNVLLSTEKGNENIQLKPKYEATYDKRSNSVQVIETKWAEVNTAWKNNIISFKNTPLSEVIETLCRWYNVSFEVEDIKAYKYSYTLTTENTLLEKLLLDLERIAPVRFTIKNEKIIVSLK